jgi:hypothetical protein
MANRNRSLSLLMDENQQTPNQNQNSQLSIANQNRFKSRNMSQVITSPSYKSIVPKQNSVFATPRASNIINSARQEAAELSQTFEDGIDQMNFSVTLDPKRTKQSLIFGAKQNSLFRNQLKEKYDSG